MYDLILIGGAVVTGFALRHLYKAYQRDKNHGENSYGSPIRDNYNRNDDACEHRNRGNRVSRERKIKEQNYTDFE